MLVWSDKRIALEEHPGEIRLLLVLCGGVHSHVDVHYLVGWGHHDVDGGLGG